MKRTPGYQAKHEVQQNRTAGGSALFIEEEYEVISKHFRETTLWNKSMRMKGTPEWYNPKTSYEIMKRYGAESREFENYLKTGKVTFK